MCSLWRYALRRTPCGLYEVYRKGCRPRLAGTYTSLADALHHVRTGRAPKGR